MAAEPLQLNSNLGLYTSFVNLVDLAAIALPAGFGDNALPFGVSLIAPAFRDLALLDLGSRFQQVPVCRAARPGPSEGSTTTVPIFYAAHQISVERYIDRLICHIALQQYEWIIAAQKVQGRNAALREANAHDRNDI